MFAEARAEKPGPFAFTRPPGALSMPRMLTPHERLAALNIVLPEPVAPIANYVPFVRLGRSVYVSGQVSIDSAGGLRGVVGEDLDLSAGHAAARMCAINLIS